MYVTNLLRCGLLIAGMVLLGIAGARAAAPAQKSFATPEEAVDALVQAVDAEDRQAVRAVLGDVSAWAFSGDRTADRAAAARFTASYAEKHALVREGDKATLTVGNQDHPFAFPLVKVGERWRFDTNAGKEELLARRIELAPEKVRLLDAVAQSVWARDALLEAHGLPAGDRGIVQADAADPAIGARCGILWGEVMRLVLLCQEINRINGALLHQLAERTSGLVASLVDPAPFSPHGHS